MTAWQEIRFFFDRLDHKCAAASEVQRVEAQMTAQVAQTQLASRLNEHDA